MDKEMKFSENVILIDIAFLNQIVSTVRTILGDRLKRKLPKVDLPAWLSYLALDAGLRNGDNEIQVLLLHSESEHILNSCEPSDLSALDGMACRTPVGEFLFSCVSPAQITSTEELFLDLMSLSLNASEVKCLMLVPFHSTYNDRVEESLRQYFKDKSEEECNKAILFAMEESKKPVSYRRDMIKYSLIQAFGLKVEEFN